MTFDPARPRYTLPFAGKEYDLLGDMALVEAVEWALKKGVGQVAVEVVGDMTSFELAKLVSALLCTCGYPMTPKAAGDHLWNDIGLAGEEMSKLRLHLYSFLKICCARPSDREAVAKEMGELIGSLERGSPGATTSASV